MDTTRRGFLRSLGFIAAAPFIVKASSLMPVRAMLSDFVEIEVELDQHNIGAMLSAITRRAFVPDLHVQIYRANPLILALSDNAVNPGGLLL